MWAHPQLAEHVSAVTKDNPCYVDDGDIAADQEGRGAGPALAQGSKFPPIPPAVNGRFYPPLPSRLPLPPYFLNPDKFPEMFPAATQSDW